MSKITLYHGTSAANAKKIMKHGFNDFAKTNWEHMPSMEGLTYLTDSYGPYYSMQATKGKYGALIKVEVDTDRLYPDEDFLIQVYMAQHPEMTAQEVVDLELSPWANKHLGVKSLEALGVCAAMSEDITIVGMKTFENKNLIWVCDPSVTIRAHRFIKERYQQMSDYIFEHGTVEGFVSTSWI